MDNPSRDEEAGLTGERVQRQRSSIPSFLFILVMLFMLTSHNGDEFLARHQYQDALRSLTWQLSNFTTWVNGTASNFSVPDRDPTVVPLLSTFLNPGVQLNPLRASYYSNITGFIHGDAKFYNISPPSLPALNSSFQWIPAAESFMGEVNMNETLDRMGWWNWTASEKVALTIVEKLPNPSANVSEKMALIHGRLDFTDSDTSEDLRFDFEGVHFISNGSIYGFAEPPGRNTDIRLLPALVPISAKNDTSRIILPELSARIDKLRDLIDAGTIESESNIKINDDSPKTRCPFTVYAQLGSTNVPDDLMQELEEEIQKPTGIWTVKPPQLKMEIVLLSRECGIMYELTNIEGVRSRTFFRKVTTYAGFAGLAYLALFILLSRQMTLSRTPSGVGRLSRWTFFSQSMMDCVSFAGHITFAILAEGRPSMSLMAPAFLGCILFVYESQFSVLIHQIQIPEQAVPAPTPAPTPAVPPAAIRPPVPQPSSPPQDDVPSTTTTPASVPTVAPVADTLPTPVQQTTPPPPPSTFLQFFWHHIRTDPQARLWMTLFFFLISVVRVILSPLMSMLFVAFTYSMIWMPQIIRSVRRGRNSGLTVEYVVGTTVCRVSLLLYFLACPKNVLDVDPRRWTYFLAFFVCLQGLVLLLQEALGPTFFLPRKYTATKTYDYHPPLPLPDPEAPEQSLGDCAICMDAIHVDPSLRRGPKSPDDKDWEVKTATGLAGSEKRQRKSSVSSISASEGGSVAGGIFSAMQMGVGKAVTRKNYSLAPCQHLFHTDCLERWLAIKNICPQCRRPLPPL